MVGTSSIHCVQRGCALAEVGVWLNVADGGSWVRAADVLRARVSHESLSLSISSIHRFDSAARSAGAAGTVSCYAASGVRGREVARRALPRAVLLRCYYGAAVATAHWRPERLCGEGQGQGSRGQSRSGRDARSQ